MSVDGLKPSRKRLTARDFVLEGIREAMLEGQLVAGQELDDQSLAEAFGVSRTPVREALKVLEVQGFVVHKPFSKPVVCPVSSKQVEEVFLMRIALEGVAVAKACLAMDNETLVQLESYSQASVQALARRDVREWSRWNREFHTRLAACSGLALLSREIGSLIELSGFYSRVFRSELLERFAEATGEHSRLLDACRRRDPELATRVLQSHLRAACAIELRLAHEHEASAAVPA